MTDRRRTNRQQIKSMKGVFECKIKLNSITKCSEGQLARLDKSVLFGGGTYKEGPEGQIVISIDVFRATMDGI